MADERGEGDGFSQVTVESGIFYVSESTANHLNVITAD